MAAAAGTLFVVLLICIIAGAVAWRFTSAGTKGELLMRYRYLRALPRQHYVAFHDLYVPRPKDPAKTNQLDHVLVSQHGVFVVETKNIAGRIFGEAGDRTWTLTYGRGRKHKMQNPVRQSRQQAKALANFLGLENNQVIPLVAFVGAGQLQTHGGDTALNKHTIVTAITDHRAILISESEAARVSNQLRSHIRATPRAQVRARHKAQVMQEQAVAEQQRLNRRRNRP